jgi:hypothetical protein
VQVGASKIVEGYRGDAEGIDEFAGSGRRSDQVVSG